MTFKDGTAFEAAAYMGREYVEIFNGTDLERTSAFLFSAEFSDDLIVEVDVHPEACQEDVEEAEVLAFTYAEVLGRIPRLFRKNITNLHLRPGC